MKNLLKFLIIILVFAKNIFAGQIFSVSQDSSTTNNYTRIEQLKVVIEKSGSLKKDLKPTEFEIEQEISVEYINNRNSKYIYVGQGLSYSTKYYLFKCNNQKLYYAAKEDSEKLLVYAGDTENKLIEYCKSISPEHKQEKSVDNYNGKEEVEKNEF